MSAGAESRKAGIYQDDEGIVQMGRFDAGFSGWYLCFYAGAGEGQIGRCASKSGRDSPPGSAA